MPSPCVAGASRACSKKRVRLGVDADEEERAAPVVRARARGVSETHQRCTDSRCRNIAATCAVGASIFCASSSAARTPQVHAEDGRRNDDLRIRATPATLAAAAATATPHLGRCRREA